MCQLMESQRIGHDKQQQQVLMILLALFTGFMCQAAFHQQTEGVLGELTE